ncbi:RidA family protein [Streptomyces zaomyceticus]|uniref:RidA family protein n=1 Tax=Streptomyces zaomyceticus TaxID=68286 RepID=UPI002E14FEB4|nr:RidA family protein [Streptomyces zaomyceticus]WSQ23514.1 RidA family protein [Streptomyces zaomyceticus]
MTVQHLSPEGMLQPVPYHHVAVGTGTKHVHVSGQIARQADGAPVAPGDLAGQVAQALRNTAIGLTGAGATFADVLRLTFYVTQWAPEKIGDFMAGVAFTTGLEVTSRSPGKNTFSNLLCGSSL